jgi:hypothetical protein
MEKMTELEALCESVVLELIEIKMHLCNQRYFEGGVGLGGLISSLLNRQYKEQEERKKDKESQDENCCENCEENDSQESYYLQYLREKKMREDFEKNAKELSERIKKYDAGISSLQATYNAIFLLQDLLMRLMKFKRIDIVEWPTVINTLTNTGVEQVDIDVICKGQIK